MRYFRGPWKCEQCSKIFESLDEPGAGKSNVGGEPTYACKDCCATNMPDVDLLDSIFDL